MKNHRRKFTSRFKSKVVLEAISERETLSDLALKFDLHRNQIIEWKKKFLANVHLVFELEENPSSEKKSSIKNNGEIMNENMFSPFSSVSKNSN